QLQRLLEQRRRLRQKAVLQVALADAHVLRDGTVDLSRTRVQIAQRVRHRQIPRLVLDDRLVLGNGLIELAQLQRLLGVAQRRLAIKRHCPPHRRQTTAAAGETTCDEWRCTRALSRRRGALWWRSPCGGEGRRRDTARATAASTDRA